VSSSVNRSVNMSGTMPPAAPAAPIGSRVAAIDVVRGAVMLLMAIDHVRVYAGVPPGGPSPELFLTRWITHFCAPAFVFLAGTSAFFRGRKHARLSRVLLVRGLWLVLLELTVVRLAWTFNLDFARQMAGVIWVIGWSMVGLAGLVKLPLRAIAAIGIVVIAAHNLIDARRAEKYPASLAFLLMTLGPTIALLPALERARGALWQPMRLFGRVPFFYYVLHIPLIHGLALLVSLVRTGAVDAWLFTNHPMGNPPPPEGYTWSLPLLYGVWGIAVLLLYPPCRWMDRLKTSRRSWWSSYV
jgi:uncharacterized membrane protein